ncbi:MAG: DNA primase [Candidatus Spyradocola sp.]|jgi:DNA primase
MAGRFPSEWIDEVRDRSDIVSVVSEYVPLRRKGAKFWGLCPFHGEKTPSFSVDQERQLYYCFGCHAGGNVITFVMNMERMEFPEAVVHLAERAHMAVPERTGSDPVPKQNRDRLYAALTAAAKFYYKTLYSPEGENALRYLYGRGIRDNVIRHFGLGATGSAHTSLTAHLREQGFSDKELVEANLALERGGRVFDTFRDRVMFPIFDPRGRVIAFGGRVIGQGEPKYLNSGDTPVFNKRKNVYGLNFLKGGHRDRLRLVEGYMDVVSLYQHGVDGCVATLGTALTPEQIRLMKRYAPEILLTYDGDGAGQRAIARGLDLFEAENVPARVTVVPDKMDPDEYVRANGGQALEALGSVDPTTYRLDALRAQFDLDDPEARARYAVEGAKVIRRLQDPVEIERFVGRLHEETGFTRETLLEQVGKRPSPREAGREAVAPGMERPRGGETKADAYLRAEQELAALLGAGERVPEGLIRAEDFTDPACAFVARLALSGQTGRIQQELEQVEDEALRGSITRLLTTGERVDPERRARMIADCTDALRRRRLEAEIDECQARAAKPGLTLEEQVAVAARLSELYDRVERLRRGAKSPGA